jgi:hypothetical protein
LGVWVEPLQAVTVMVPVTIGSARLVVILARPETMELRPELDLEYFHLILWRG